MYKVFSLSMMVMVLTAGIAFAKPTTGVIDMQVIAAESEPTKNAMATMQSKYGKERDSLNAQAKSLQEKEESLSKQFATLSKDALNKRRTELLNLQKDLGEKSRAFGAKVEKDEIKIKQDIFNLVNKASEIVAKRKGLDSVVDVAAGGVVFYTKSMNITKEVLAEVNKLWEK